MSRSQSKLETPGLITKLILFLNSQPVECDIYHLILIQSEAYSKPCQTPERLEPLTIFAKHPF